MTATPGQVLSMALLLAALGVAFGGCTSSKGGRAGSGKTAGMQSPSGAAGESGGVTSGGIVTSTGGAAGTGAMSMAGAGGGTGGLATGGNAGTASGGQAGTGGGPPSGGTTDATGTGGATTTGGARTGGNTGGGGTTGSDGGAGIGGNSRSGGSSGTGSGTGTEGLTSTFLRSDGCALAVLAGKPYEMRDPQWRVGSDINRDTCAFKFLAALNLLGYNTETGRYDGGTDYNKEPVNMLAKFQGKHALPAQSRLERETLLALDRQLAAIEPVQAAAGAGFPLRDHMQALHKNDVSVDAVAAIYHLPMSVLPARLHMDVFETLQCVAFQCNGFILDGSGADIARLIDPASDWSFAAAYYDSTKEISRYPSAAVHAQTVLHEFAHYLNKLSGVTIPNQPLAYSIDTTGFYQIGFVLPTANPTRVNCAQRRSDDPLDYVSRYGFQSSYECSEGLNRPSEDFAEAFSLYVVAGRHFRAAAAKRATIQAQYDWLKHNVFEGIEYDTANNVGTNVGCNDVPGLEDRLPGYFSCSEDAVWDWTLPVLSP